MEEDLKKNREKKALILHGWSYSTEKWGPFIDLLKRQGINPVMLQVPGLTSEIDRPWKIDNYVQWLKNIIDKEKRKVILIGHSNGGRIALAYASKYPKEIEKLILVDSAGIYHNELPIKIKRFLFKQVARVGKKLGDRQKLKNILYALAREEDYKNASPIMKQTMVNLMSVNLLPELNKIIAPTLIIWGSLDTITPLADGQLMNKRIQNSKLFIVKNASHSPHFTHPKEVADKIFRYLVNEHF